MIFTLDERQSGLLSRILNEPAVAELFTELERQSLERARRNFENTDIDFGKMAFEKGKLEGVKQVFNSLNQTRRQVEERKNG